MYYLKHNIVNRKPSDLFSRHLQTKYSEACPGFFSSGADSFFNGKHNILFNGGQNRGRMAREKKNLSPFKFVLPLGHITQEGGWQNILL